MLYYLKWRLVYTTWRDILYNTVKHVRWSPVGCVCLIVI
jgi:hypothetical protein